MEEITLPGEDSDSADTRPDGGEESPSTLGSLKENAESHYREISLFDKLPGRLVFAAGALSGSLFTVLFVFIYVRFV